MARTSVHSKMRLCLFINPTGHHQAAWRHPGGQADAGINLAHYVELAQLAENAKFDAIFLADNQGVRGGDPDVVARVAQYVANFEPLTLLSALAAVTKRIGLIATASTSFNFPYQVARKFASLDHLSSGRAGWNIVTSGSSNNEEANFGSAMVQDHDERYARAAEFVDICQALWDSWDDDAFVRDKASGLFTDMSKMHVLGHKGHHFSVRGPLNVPRPPQGYPVLVQAGSSGAGKDFAARYAEMVFVTPQGIEPARAIYSEIKQRAVACGRSPDQVKVMPGLALVVGRTDAEAREKHAVLQSLMTEPVALNLLSMRMGGFDLSRFDLDRRFPDDIEQPVGSRSGFDSMVERSRREGLSVRELAIATSGSLAGLSMYGSVSTIVDLMERWFEEGACDGFNLQPAVLPETFRDVVDLILPELRRRGLFREEYDGATLRDHLGLIRPASRYA